LEFSSAGHPPPRLITHDGDTRYLTGGRGLLLGVDSDSPRPHATEPLPARSTVLLYTDGLMERRGEGLDAGMTRLRQHAATLGQGQAAQDGPGGLLAVPRKPQTPSAVRRWPA
jgi:serine phosphatase RsbU (regulator of sigma subunit)